MEICFERGKCVTAWIVCIDEEYTHTHTYSDTLPLSYRYLFTITLHNYHMPVHRSG